jgi:hypothetical protein
VTLLPEGDTTGRHVRELRKAMNEDAMGDVMNVLLAHAACIRVTGWEIPGRPALPLPQPLDKAQSYLDMLPARDVIAIEDLILPWAREMAGMRQREDSAEGEGAPPATA